MAVVTRAAAAQCEMGLLTIWCVCVCSLRFLSATAQAPAYVVLRCAVVLLLLCGSNVVSTFRTCARIHVHFGVCL